ncbi:MAG: hypothetical protein KJ879_01890 [Nanoarchaeota archaeon]|nr:hypothetical protein [Nanoarchaeota archaeon]
MSFNHLEDNLEGKNVLSYLKFLDEVQEPTRTVFGYTLDLASYLDSFGLRDEYALFGGYGVLSHLMNTFGVDVARAWRGSSDIDMSGDKSVLATLKMGYSMPSDRPSPNLKDKRTLKLSAQGEEECKIDFYEGNSTKRYGPAQINNHFGVQLRVVSPEYLVRGKLKTPVDEMQHYEDILGLLAVIEKEGHNPDRVYSILNHEQAENLHTRILRGEKELGRDRFGFFPTRDFSQALRKQLHKRRLVR